MDGGRWWNYEVVAIMRQFIYIQPLSIEFKGDYNLMLDKFGQKWELQRGAQ